jgi:hypothetical protein
VFITKATKTHRTLRSKIALVSAVSLSLAAGSAALAAPAHAAGSVPPTASAQASSLFVTGQVTFQKPYIAGFSASGKKLVAYSGKVVFPFGGHLVQVRHELWEDDRWPNMDDLLGKSYFSKYVQNDGTFKFKSIHPLIRTDADGTEEVYQRVSYRVYKHGQWSAWSKWVYSEIYRM